MRSYKELEKGKPKYVFFRGHNLEVALNGGAGTLVTSNDMGQEGTGNPILQRKKKLRRFNFCLASSRSMRACYISDTTTGAANKVLQHSRS